MRNLSTLRVPQLCVRRINKRSSKWIQMMLAINGLLMNRFEAPSTPAGFNQPLLLWHYVRPCTCGHPLEAVPSVHTAQVLSLGRWYLSWLNAADFARVKTLRAIHKQQVCVCVCVSHSLSLGISHNHRSFLERTSSHLRRILLTAYRKRAFLVRRSRHTKSLDSKETNTELT